MKLRAPHIELLLDKGWRGWADRHSHGDWLLGTCLRCRTALSPQLRLNPPLCSRCERGG